MMMAHGVEKVTLTDAYILPLGAIPDPTLGNNPASITQPWWNSYQIGVPRTTTGETPTGSTVSGSAILGSALKQGWQDIGAAFAKPRSATNESSGGKAPEKPTDPLLAEDPFTNGGSKINSKTNTAKTSSNPTPKPTTTAVNNSTTIATTPTVAVQPNTPITAALPPTTTIATTQPLALGATPITPPANAPIIPTGLASSMIPQQPTTIEGQIQQLTLENAQLKALLASKTTTLAAAPTGTSTTVGQTAPRSTNTETDATTNTTAFLPCGCPNPNSAASATGCGCAPATAMKDKGISNSSSAT
jgi:hypothetical protein